MGGLWPPSTTGSTPVTGGDASLSVEEPLSDLHPAELTAGALRLGLSAGDSELIFDHSCAA